MGYDVAGEFHEQYSRMFGVVAGYLPPNPQAVHEWHADLAERLEAVADDETEALTLSPAMRAMSNLLIRDGIVRMYVTQMIEQAKARAPISPGKPNTIKDIDQLLAALSRIVTLAPRFEADPEYRNFFPMSTLFVYMMATPAGYAAFRHPAFNAAITGLLKEWCAYLDSPASKSVLNDGPNGWLSPPARKLMNLDEFDEPPGGWPSYNAFFHREIKAAARPLNRDPGVVVSANDGTMYNIARGVEPFDEFWMKGQPYSLMNLLAGQEVGRFAGGDVFQSFLSGSDYHRFRAPIDGRVTRAEVVQGLTFSQADVVGWDPDAGVLSMGYDANVNTRGLVFIDSGSPLGTVCVIPIGITEISSVTWFVKPGDVVKKGDPLGWFSFGGSTLALVFEPGTIERFLIARPPYGKNPPQIKVNAGIALARR